MTDRPFEDEGPEKKDEDELVGDTQEIEDVDEDVEDVEDVEDLDAGGDAADEGAFPARDDEDLSQEEMVPCAYCGEPHPAGALRCRSCTGWLPVIEETVHKEHFFFLFCAFSLFVGTLLDWEWGLPGSAGILGGFLLITSGYAVFASLVNIWYRRMIVWPHLTAMVIGLWAGWQRVIQLFGNASKAGLLQKEGDSFKDLKVYLDKILHLFAPGLWIVVIISTALLVFLIVSIFVAGKRDAQRKAAMRAERVASRGPSRRR